MTQTNETVAILTSNENDADRSMTRSSWPFLLNNISPAFNGNFSFRSLLFSFLGLLAIVYEVSIKEKLTGT